jgi:hypothetical protein
MDRKLAALLEHRSQYRTTMQVDDPSSTEQLDRFRDRMRERAASAGADAGIPYAEQFKLIAKL